MKAYEMNNQLYSLLGILKDSCEEVIPETNTTFWKSYRKWKDQMGILRGIKERLSNEDAEHLEKYADAAAELYEMENNNAFLTGFKYGFSFANWINDPHEPSSFQFIRKEDIGNSPEEQTANQQVLNREIIKNESKKEESSDGCH